MDVRHSLRKTSDSAGLGKSGESRLMEHGACEGPNPGFARTCGSSVLSRRSQSAAPRAGMCPKQLHPLPTSPPMILPELHPLSTNENGRPLRAALDSFASGYKLQEFWHFCCASSLLSMFVVALLLLSVSAKFPQLAGRRPPAQVGKDA